MSNAAGAPDNGTGGEPGADTVRFNALWSAHSSRVLAYALRHVDRYTAQEIVAETFLVAWRRLADVPGEPLPWLLVVARNTLSNHRRSDYRRNALHKQVEDLERVALPAPGADLTVADRAEVLAALAKLTDTEREALLLTAWDGLTPAQAAAVAGCTTPAFHVRLHRARRRLRAAVADAPVGDGPDRDRLTTTMRTSP